MYKYEKHVLRQVSRVNESVLPTKIDFNKEIELIETEEDLIFMMLVINYLFKQKYENYVMYNIDELILYKIESYCPHKSETIMGYAQRIAENSDVAFMAMDAILFILDNIKMKNLTLEQENSTRVLYVAAREMDRITGDYYEEPLDRIEENLRIELRGSSQRPIDAIKPFRDYLPVKPEALKERAKTSFERVDYVLRNIKDTTGVNSEYVTVSYFHEGVLEDELVFYDKDVIEGFARRDFIIIFDNEKEYLESFVLIDKVLRDYVIRPADVHAEYKKDFVFWHISRENRKTYLRAGTKEDLDFYILPKYQTRGYNSTIEAIKFKDMIFEAIPSELLKESSRSPIPVYDSIKNNKIKRRNVKDFIIILAISFALNLVALSTHEISARINEVKEDITYTIQGGINKHE